MRIIDIINRYGNGREKSANEVANALSPDRKSIRNTYRIVVQDGPAPPMKKQLIALRYAAQKIGVTLCEAIELWEGEE